MLNSGKDRTTIEETFRQLLELAASLNEEQMRAAREGLSEDEQALFDLLTKDSLDKASRERQKQASRELLAAQERLAELDRFWEKEQTKGEVEAMSLDKIYASLSTPRGQCPCPRLAAGDERRILETVKRLDSFTTTW